MKRNPVRASSSKSPEPDLQRAFFQAVQETRGKEHPLSDAAKHELTDTVQQLIAAGLPLNEPLPGRLVSADERYPARFILQVCVESALTCLLEAGADPNLAEALCSPRLGPVAAEVLLRYGADPDAVDERGRSALLRYLTSGAHNVMGAEDVAQLLIRAATRFDTVDAKGWTALHWAAFVYGPSVAIALLEAGADPDARSSKPANSFPRGVRPVDVRSRDDAATKLLGASTGPAPPPPVARTRSPARHPAPPQGYRHALDALFAELEDAQRRGLICDLTREVRAEVSSQSELDGLEREHGIRLGPAVRQFFTEVGGYTVSWRLSESFLTQVRESGLLVEDVPHGFDLFPARRVFASWKDVLWFTIDGERRFENVKPLDFFAAEACSAFALGSAPVDEVWYHYCGERLSSSRLSFDAWFDKLLQTRGYWYWIAWYAQKDHEEMREGIAVLKALFPVVRLP